MSDPLTALLDAGSATVGIPDAGGILDTLKSILNIKGKTQHATPTQGEQVGGQIEQAFLGVITATGSNVIEAYGQWFPTWLKAFIGNGQYWNGPNSIAGTYVIDLCTQYEMSTNMQFRAQSSAHQLAMWIARNVDLDAFDTQFTAVWKDAMGQLNAVINSEIPGVITVPITVPVSPTSATTKSTQAGFTTPLIIAALIGIVLIGVKKK
jgi:hypothetical protein